MLRVLDLFSGIGGFSLGLEKSGYFETTMFCEIEDYCQRVLEKNFPDVPIVSDVTSLHVKEGEYDVMCGGFPCFVKDTMVFTKVGYKPIQDINIGEYVLTHKRRWRQVTQKHITKDRQIRHVEGTGFLRTDTTDEHPYYVRPTEQVWDNPSRKYIRKFLEPTFLEAKNLKGSHVGLTYIPDTVEDSHSEDFWWLVGLCIACGWCVTHHDKEFVDFFSKVGIGADKHIPNEWLMLPKDKLSALLDGYFYEAGSPFTSKSGRRGLRCSTVSKRLALNLQMAILKCYSILPDVIEGRTVDQKPFYQVQYADFNSSYVDGEYGWGLCRKSIASERFDTVYNIAVEEDESYIANGAIVHNCQDISIAGRGVGLEGERSGLWFEYCRLIKEGRPKYAIIENVSALLGRGLSSILRNLAEIGYDATWTLFDSKYFGVPQRRRRVYILAVRDGIPSDTDIFEFARRGAAQLGEQMEAVHTGFTHHFKEKESGRGISYFTLQRSDSYAELGVSNTLAKRDYKSATDLVLEDGYLRRVTPTERLRLQGIPEDWFDGCGLSNTQKFKCNGMTIPVIEYIGNRIKAFDLGMAKGYELPYTYEEIDW
jgi:site-specific DNA-cytosine methylase